VEFGGRGSILLAFVGLLAILLLYLYSSTHQDMALGRWTLWILLAVGAGLEITWLIMRRRSRGK
jgi:hypothetical protein